VIRRRRKLAFALTAMMLSGLGTSGLLLAADLLMHQRAERSAGLNRWGYRGPVVGRKQPGEMRAVMVGGSTVFGYGGPWHEAAPAFLEAELRRAHPDTPITVVNLGYNNEGAFAALPTLEDYRYLDYDLVILYEGYNDRVGDGGPNTQVYRRQSVIFRWTGYSPILPLVFEEKARVLRTGGVGGGAGQPVFEPGLAARSGAAALEAAQAIGDLLGRQLERVAAAPPAEPAPGADCAAPWSKYCESMIRATRYARDAGAKVLIVHQPIHPDPGRTVVERAQQRALGEAVQRRFGDDPGVVQLDLSSAIDLTDRNYSFDTMHLGRDGNYKLAQLMRPAVERLALPMTR
jgi:hypothetical protein